MFVGNFLTTGDFITIMPIGLVITLQYDENGRIQKVLNGSYSDGEDVTSQLLPIMLESNFIPRTIPIHDGTSWVTGVAYTGHKVEVTGELPMCMTNGLIESFLQDPSKFTFYAGMIHSLAAIYHGAVECRKWLNLAKFKLLPGYPVTSEISDDMVVQMMSRNDCIFDISELCGYILYHQGEPDIQYLNLMQCKISDVSKFVDGFGYIYGDVKYECAGERKSIRVPYSEVVKYNLVGDIYVRMSDEEIYYSMSTVFVGSQLTCSVCGNLFETNMTGRTACSDPHCRSKLLGPTNHFLSQLNLPTVTAEVYQKFVADKDNFCVPDILESANYVDISVDTTPSAVLRALVPYNVLPETSDILVRICNRCNNALNTLQYYIKHPDRLTLELDITDTGNLLTWLSDDYNANMLVKALNCKQLNFTSQGIKFDGAPIFRNWKIAITGEFLHGTKRDIESILSSYAGTVVDNMEEARCLIVGSTKEGIEGKKVLSAKDRGIKIFDEMEFFQEYEIDKDLAENL